MSRWFSQESYADDRKVAIHNPQNGVKMVERNVKVNISSNNVARTQEIQKDKDMQEMNAVARIMQAAANFSAIQSGNGTGGQKEIGNYLDFMEDCAMQLESGSDSLTYFSRKSTWTMNLGDHGSLVTEHTQEIIGDGRKRVSSERKEANLYPKQTRAETKEFRNVPAAPQNGTEPLSSRQSDPVPQNLTAPNRRGGVITRDDERQPVRSQDKESYTRADYARAETEKLTRNPGSGVLERDADAHSVQQPSGAASQDPRPSDSQRRGGKGTGGDERQQGGSQDRGSHPNPDDARAGTEKAARHGGGGVRETHPPGYVWQDSGLTAFPRRGGGSPEYHGPREEIVRMQADTRCSTRKAATAEAMMKTEAESEKKQMEFIQAMLSDLAPRKPVK